MTNIECQVARLSAKIATPFQERIEHLARLGERHALWMLTGVPGSDQWPSISLYLGPDHARESSFGTTGGMDQSPHRMGHS